MPTCLNQRFSSVSGLAKGIRLPLPVEGWLPSDLGCMPPDFLETGILGATPAFNLLKYSHPHERDGRLKFDEPSHTYYVDGIPVDCSVTQFLSAFQEPFDADGVISRMEQTAWPRPQYLTFMHLRKAIQFAQGFPFLQPLLSLLQAHPIDKLSVCEILQQAPTHESWDGARYLLTMTRDEIKTFWKRNGEDASRRGTWAHLQCECILNAGQVTSPGPEMLSLSQFLQTSERLIAYRSEWSIWATEENLAGSIDFCATDPEGCLVLIDWKRSKNLKTKYFSFFSTMKGELSHIPDAVGWKYRLQLNLYKYVLEKYYGFSVSRMLVVDIHPDSVSNPFIDDVPDMQAEVRSILATRKRNLQSATTSDIQGADASLLIDDVRMGGKIKRAHDVLGGADLDKSQASMLEEESQVALAPTPSRPSAPGDVHVKEEGETEVDEVNEDDPLLSNVKKRRLMKGACATMSAFEGMFRQYEDAAQHDLGAVSKDRQDTDSCSILSRVKDLRELVQNKYPGWSEHIVRLGAAALSAYRARLSERIFVGDSAFFLWLIEGDRFIRVHEGFCYIYNDNGSFLPYTGIPPQAVLLRVANFFGQLEGLFRRLDPATVREDAAILSAISVDLARFPREDLYLEACIEAAIWQKSVPTVDFDADDEFEEEPAQARNDGKPGVSWNLSLAKRIWKLCQCIRNEMMHDKLISLLVEWCETANARRPCVSFVDTCVQYDISRENHLMHVKKSALNDCYVYIPHPLLDPVLTQHNERLQKFYSQTFWANNDVFHCCLAAMALAKRGFNVDRCFIGESPGGVGQSLFSMHLDAMLGPNHGYFDPNVWYNEDELRKQIESFARCIVVTGQEAPESHKKLHLDLFKKTMSGDGIAGRKPYGYTTRMFSIVGWKRLEVNRMMVFAGITQANFQSVMRRSLVWKPKARFHPDAVLKQAHADHELDGHFLADPSLKQFLISAPACAAGLRIQHAFELQHSQTDCVQIIDDYATGGDDFLTEDKMRKACGLSIRVRHAETAAGGAGLLQVSDSQEERDEEESQYQALRDFLVQHLLQKGLSDITFWEFKRITLNVPKKPNAPPQTLFQQLEKRRLMQKGCRKGKAKDVLQPILECKKDFKDLISTAQLDCSEQFLESVNAEQMQHYLHSNECRASNVETWKQFLESEITKEKKKGRPSADDAVRRQQLQDRLRKAESYENICSHLSKLDGPGPPPSARSPAKRHRSKSNPVAANPAPDADSYLVSYDYIRTLEKCEVGAMSKALVRRSALAAFKHNFTPIPLI